MESLIFFVTFWGLRLPSSFSLHLVQGTLGVFSWGLGMVLWALQLFFWRKALTFVVLRHPQVSRTIDNKGGCCWDNLGTAASPEKFRISWRNSLRFRFVKLFLIQKTKANCWIQFYQECRINPTKQLGESRILKTPLWNLPAFCPLLL